MPARERQTACFITRFGVFFSALFAVQIGKRMNFPPRWRKKKRQRTPSAECGHELRKQE